MHPIIFKIFGPISLNSYGLMVALGFFIGINLAIRRAKKEDEDEKKISNLIVLIFFSSIIGSRLLHVFAEDFDKYLDNPIKVFYLWEGGYAFLGGYVLAVLASIWYTRKHGMIFLKIADIMSPSISIGLAFGRMGCFLAGCCYGKECDLPWAVIFPPHTTGRAGVFLHPTQIYESLSAIIIFVILLIVQNRKKFHGEVLYVFLIIYSVVRFLIEFVRDDPRGEIFGLSTSQFTGIPLFLLGVILLGYGFMKTKE